MRELKCLPLEEETRRFPCVGCNHSKIDAPLVKAEPISNAGDSSVTTYLEGVKPPRSSCEGEEGEKMKKKNKLFRNPGL